MAKVEKVAMAQVKAVVAREKVVETAEVKVEVLVEVLVDAEATEASHSNMAAAQGGVTVLEAVV